MEFPDLVLSLIREFSRPCVSEEGRKEYQRYVKHDGASTNVLRAMVTPLGILAVATYNDEMEACDSLLRHYLYTPLSRLKAGNVRAYVAERQILFGEEIQDLLAKK